MFFKLLILALLGAVMVSLFIGFLQLTRSKPTSTGTVKALTVRVTLLCSYLCITALWVRNRTDCTTSNTRLTARSLLRTFHLKLAIDEHSPRFELK